jgi:hypothetical protein
MLRALGFACLLAMCANSVAAEERHDAYARERLRLTERLNAVVDARVWSSGAPERLAWEALERALAERAAPHRASAARSARGRVRLVLEGTRQGG